MAKELEAGQALPGMLMRPVRLKSLHVKQELTDEDKLFIKVAQSEDFPVLYIPNAKDSKTGKKMSKSAVRYNRYQQARTLNEARGLGALQADIMWDYCRGYIIFEGREPYTMAHYAGSQASQAALGLSVTPIER